jgi:hypothetical protein
MRKFKITDHCIYPDNKKLAILVNYHIEVVDIKEGSRKIDRANYDFVFGIGEHALIEVNRRTVNVNSEIAPKFYFPYVKELISNRIRSGKLKAIEHCVWDTQTYKDEFIDFSLNELEDFVNKEIVVEEITLM